MAKDEKNQQAEANAEHARDVLKAKADAEQQGKESAEHTAQAFDRPLVGPRQPGADTSTGGAHSHAPGSEGDDHFHADEQVHAHEEPRDDAFALDRADPQVRQFLLQQGMATMTPQGGFRLKEQDDKGRPLPRAMARPSEGDAEQQDPRAAMQAANDEIAALRTLLAGVVYANGGALRITGAELKMARLYGDMAIPVPLPDDGDVYLSTAHRAPSAASAIKVAQAREMVGATRQNTEGQPVKHLPGQRTGEPSQPEE